MTLETPCIADSKIYVHVPLFSGRIKHGAYGLHFPSGGCKAIPTVLSTVGSSSFYFGFHSHPLHFMD